MSIPEIPYYFTRWLGSIAMSLWNPPVKKESKMKKCPCDNLSNEECAICIESFAAEKLYTKEQYQKVVDIAVKLNDKNCYLNTVNTHLIDLNHELRLELDKYKKQR